MYRRQSYKLRSGDKYGVEGGETGGIFAVVVSGVDNTEPAVLFIFFTLCCAVFLFGLGYISVVVNAVASRGIVLIGAIGKICFFAMGLYGYLHGIASLIFIIVVCMDLIWAAFFFFYLISTHRISCER